VGAINDVYSINSTSSINDSRLRFLRNGASVAWIGLTNNTSSMFTGASQDYLGIRGDNGIYLGNGATIAQKIVGGEIYNTNTTLDNTATYVQTIDNVTGKLSKRAISTFPASSQVQSDWNASTGLGVILNKPEIWDVDEKIQSITASLPTGSVFSTNLSGTGATTTQATRVTGDNYVRANFTTGTTATGRNGLITNLTSMLFESGKTSEIIIRRFRLPTALTATCGIYLGFGDVTTAEPVDGAYFKLTNIGGLTLTCVTSSNSVRSNSSTFAITSNTDYDLRIVATSTIVAFYIDNTLFSTITTNIPNVSGREFGVIAIIAATAGTTSQSFQLDDIKFAVR
jgi:hypothetical protein